jgi:hypothetical protein
MGTHVFESFENRGMLAIQYLSGAKLDSPPAQQQIVQDQQPEQQQIQQHQQRHQPQQLLNDHFQQPLMQNTNQGLATMNSPNVGQNFGVDLFGGSNGMGGHMNMGQSNGHVGLNDVEFVSQRPHRNYSIISFDGGRNMSFASDEAQ